MSVVILEKLCLSELSIEINVSCNDLSVFVEGIGKAKDLVALCVADRYFGYNNAVIFIFAGCGNLAVCIVACPFVNLAVAVLLDDRLISFGDA